MKRSSYRSQDYAFGQSMLTLRTAISLTQAGLAEFLGVSRRAVGDWEAGNSYPKAEHLRQLIALAVKHRVFEKDHEAEQIRVLWYTAHQKVLLSETWLTALLAAPDKPVAGSALPVEYLADNPQRTSAVQHGTWGLPFQPTTFVGRVTELSEIARLLSDPACRLLTLVGPGGIGKTRLALEVTADRPDTFTDGAAFVTLASVGGPTQIVSAIGDALNLSFASQSDPRAYLLNYLRERRLLLILDNFEHLLDSADLIDDILQKTRYLSILVTSRERLNLRAEWLFDVEGLSYPSGESSRALQSPAQLAEYNAVQLFAQRAAQVQSGFLLSGATLPVVIQICQHVAGMPLALELAAAGIRTQSITDIEQHIRSNLDALSTTLRDVPARHRSMRAVFDHSWNLLGESERVLFTRLAAFRGSFTAAAAEQVAGATRLRLMTLVDKSLLRQDAVLPQPNADLVAMDSAADSRFFLLEPIREYALEKLVVCGEAEALRRAHATYYLGLAEMGAAQWDTPSVDSAIALLNREHDNLRAALRWACNGGDLTIGLQLAGALWRFWRGNGDINEGRAWLAELLVLDDATSTGTDPAVRLRALHGAAWLASDQRDFAQAEQLFEQSITLRRASSKTLGETNLLLNAARQARAAGQYQRATELLEDALTQQHALGDRGSSGSAGLGLSLYEMALVSREQGNLARAAQLYQECLNFHQEIGDREGMTSALLGLGDVARDQGNAADAWTYSEQSLAIFRELGIQWAIGFALNNLAQAAYLENNLSQAFVLVSESVALFRGLKDDGGLAEVLITQGHIWRMQGDPEKAEESLTEALRLSCNVGPRLLMAAALEGLASVMSMAASSTQTQLAVHCLATAATLRAEMGTPVRPADQVLVQNMLAALQSSLGSKVFAAQWAQTERQPVEAILDAILSKDSNFIGNAPVPAEDRRRLDWGDALAVPTFYGREWELALLTEWVIQERCRMVGILGLGGVGKSALSVSLMRQIAEHFEVVIWRSLRDAPSCEALLDDCFHVLALQPPGQMPSDLDQRLQLFCEYLRGQRVLLVLDNLETVLDEGEASGRMRPDYEGYERLLRRVGETEHQSCLLFTSREKPINLGPLEGSRSSVRVLRLARLETKPCEQLFAEKGVTGTDSERARLVDMYAGNPLALKIVAQTIVDLFDGEIALFLEQGEIIFGDVRKLLAEQFVRLSASAQSVLFWLAILREPSTLDELLSVFITPLPRARLLEAIEALHRHSLIERGQKQGSFTLQSVVLEYVTAQLIAEISDEILTAKPIRLIEHGLELAQASEYVRQTQSRLIVRPIQVHLRSAHPQQTTVEELLLALLDAFTTRSTEAQGYGPANLVTLLHVQRGDLCGLDLSRLVLRSVYLQGVAMQDTNLTGTLLQGCVFTETFDALTAVAISKTGKYWAATSRRGEIRIWIANSQIVYRTWHAHSGMIYHLTFSSDGRTLASGGWDGLIKLWDVESGALLWSGSHTSHINNVAFSPDGRMLASSGEDATVRLWDRQSGIQLHVLPHPSPVCGDGVTWSPDGQLIASGDAEGVIRLWQVRENEPPICVQTLAAHTNWVDGLAFSPDGCTLASASFDGTVKLWDMPDGHLKQTLTGHSSRVFRVAWSPDGRTLASSSFDQTVCLWDVEHARYRAVLRGHTAGVGGLAFTPDSRRLLSGSEDGTLRLWEVANGQCIRVIQGYAVSLYGVDWSPDSRQLVTGGSDAAVTIWDVTGRTLPRVLRGHHGVVIGISWSPLGRWLASSEWDNAVRLWDATSDNCLQVLEYPNDDGNFFDGVAWSPDGERLASATYRHGVQVFDMATRRYQWAGHSFSTWIHGVAWSPDGEQLAGGSDDKLLYIWDSADGTLLRQMVGHHGTITGVAWSPDGTRLASGGSGELIVWNAKRGEVARIITEHAGNINSVTWGLDEEVVISGDREGTLRWWDVQSGKCLLVREAHQGMVQSLRRSPEGISLASCGDDGTIQLWNLHNGDHLQTLRRDRPYERLDITGIKGLTEAQKVNLRALGAIETTT